MNVYDFDETVFQPDSSYAFFLYCLKRYPGAFLRTAPAMIYAGVRFTLKTIRTKALKEKLFAFLQYLSNPEQDVQDFWDRKLAGIEPWYLAQKKDDDLIITASPAFLVGEAGRRLGITVIGTNMDIHTGRIAGENCHDAEKLRRFYSAYPEGIIENFYSDSLSDTPLARIAGRAYLVNKGKMTVWPSELS